MAYVHICPKCRGIFKYESAMQRDCPDCRIQLYSTARTDDEWNMLPALEKESIIKAAAESGRDAAKQEPQAAVQGSSQKSQAGMSNRVAWLLKIISYVVLGMGILVSMVWAIDEEAFILFILGVVGSIIAYAPIRGFAEVIELLQKIKDK